VSQNIFDVDFLRNVNQINNQPILRVLMAATSKVEAIREFRRGIAC
jgi:hypothetical protein